jgi:hypothetical protein
VGQESNSGRARRQQADRWRPGRTQRVQASRCARHILSACLPACLFSGQWLQAAGGGTPDLRSNLPNGWVVCGGFVVVHGWAAGVNQPMFGRAQQHPKRLRFCMDVSGSMRSFNGWDRRLDRAAATAIMIMESFAGLEHKFAYSMWGTHTPPPSCI